MDHRKKGANSQQQQENKITKDFRDEFSSKSALAKSLMLHQNLQRIPPQSIQRHFYWQNKLCKCYPHVKNSMLEFLPEVDSRYEGPVSTEASTERDTWYRVQGYKLNVPKNNILFLVI